MLLSLRPSDAFCDSGQEGAHGKHKDDNSDCFLQNDMVSTVLNFIALGAAAMNLAICGKQLVTCVPS